MHRIFAMLAKMCPYSCDSSNMGRGLPVHPPKLCPPAAAGGLPGTQKPHEYM